MFFVAGVLCSSDIFSPFLNSFFHMFSRKTERIVETECNVNYQCVGRFLSSKTMIFTTYLMSQVITICHKHFDI
jgi:hypothetical protein